MAEHEDPRVSAHYRSLGDEQPPEALDAAILAASRRAVGAGPRRSPMRRWALPVSIAAVVVLTMSVVVRIEVERPELEKAAPVPVTPQVLEQKAMPRADQNEAGSLEKRAVESAAQPKAKASAAPERPAAAARQFVPEPPPAGAPASAESAAQSNLGGAGARAPASAAPAPAAPAASEAQSAGKTVESPRAWLERIARLRREGHVKEADESLAEFRKRYPDYEIPKDLRQAVLGGAKAE
jgi:hypothetical protein